MAFPAFLGPATVLNPASAVHTAAPSGLAGAAPSSQSTGFTIRSQEQTNWCWAAVSTSVSYFYKTSKTWVQCDVADRALPRTDCCSAPANSDPNKCNCPWYLDRALGVTGTFKNLESRALSFSEVQAEIALSHPLGCRVGWFGGGGHFLVIAGWVVGGTGTEYIDLADPIYLNSQMDYVDFAASYQSGGDWTHSYRTEPPPPSGGVAMAALTALPAIMDLDAIGA